MYITLILTARELTAFSFQRMCQKNDDRNCGFKRLGTTDILHLNTGQVKVYFFRYSDPLLLLLLVPVLCENCFPLNAIGNPNQIHFRGIHCIHLKQIKQHLRKKFKTTNIH